MKRIIPILILAVVCVATVFGRTYTVESVPNVQRTDRTRYTSNPDGILSAEAVAAIDRACDSLRRAGKAQIAVVAVDDIAGGDVFTFAHRLFSEWGVGSKGADNGLGILLVKDKREIRFVTGDGLEGILPDALCKRIQQRYMVEPFSEGDFSRGMVDGVAAVAKIVSKGEVYADSHVRKYIGKILMLFGFGMMLCGLIWTILLLRKCPKCGKYKLRKSSSMLLGSYHDYDLIENTYVCSNCGHVERRTKKSYRIDDDDNDNGGTFIGGGFGGGRSGGGSMGGGFGGGHFGGGGAGSKF